MCGLEPVKRNYLLASIDINSKVFVGTPMSVMVMCDTLKQLLYMYTVASSVWLHEVSLSYFIAA